MTEIDQQSDERLRARAKHVVYERLALASTAIWTIGAFILMATIVPVVAHPQKYIMIASVVPLVPASLPWFFWKRLTDGLVRRWRAAPRAAAAGTGGPG
jgi:hypothetical protein